MPIVEYLFLFLNFLIDTYPSTQTKSNNIQKRLFNYLAGSMEKMSFLKINLEKRNSFIANPIEATAFPVTVYIKSP